MEVQLFYKSKSLLNKLGSKENPCHIAYLLTTILLLDKIISKESPSEEFIVRGWEGESGEKKKGDEDKGKMGDRKRERRKGRRSSFPLLFI